MALNSVAPYQFIWRDSSQESYLNLVLTLSGLQSLAVLTLLGILIAFTQTRWWIITRYFLKQALKKSFELPDPHSPLHDLTQVQAVKRLIFGNKDIHHVSPLFGLASIINSLLFLVLSAVIPYCLTAGSGPATVQALGSQECDGLHTYTNVASQLAGSFYEQCHVNYSANGDSCTYMSRIVPAKNRFRTSLHFDCPFAEFTCANFMPSWLQDHCDSGTEDSRCSFTSVYNQALRIEYLDALPSEYSLNANRNMHLSHRVTCAPVHVKKFTTKKIEIGHNATVFWVGYPYLQINKTETWAAVGQTRHYNTNSLLHTSRGPFKLDFGMVYDKVVYPLLDKTDAGGIYENFHPGLKRDDGDVFVVLFHYSVGVDIPAMLACHLYSMGSPTDIQSGQPDGNPEDLRPLSMLMETTSLKYFLASHEWSAMTVRDYPLKDSFAQPPTRPEQQWHWEVKAWFSQAFLTVKFSMLTSSQGENRRESINPLCDFANTSWICDKILYLDDNYTNVNFIGFMASLGGIALVFLLTYIEKPIRAVKLTFGRLRAVCQAAWKRLQRHARKVGRCLGVVKAFIISVFKGSWDPLKWIWVIGFAKRRSGLRNIDISEYSDSHEMPSIHHPPV
ncbi:hypothetical protein BDZ45DRAFT_690094 [Acephala macrosclerotiorum]|nr:hypothetical protein BDZ45DRAFT_690094 [Acephala macrosclerotiorum]